MTRPIIDPVPGSPARFIVIHRVEVVSLALVGVVLGIVAVIWPAATLLTIAVVFGVYLVCSGIFRITAAFLSRETTTALRWLGAVLGLLVAAAGVYCLASPERSLLLLALAIGFGWVAEGVIDILAGVQGVVSPAWLAYVSGVVSILAGIAAFVLPGLAVTTFLFFAAVLLIAVSLTTLLTLPRRYSIAVT